MYNDQNPLVGQAMAYLEIAARYVLLNFLWLLSIFPFAVVFFMMLRYAFGMENAPWVLIFVPVAMAAPATGGLFYAANQMAHGEGGGPLDYWEGVRTYLWPSYRWMLMNIAVAFLFSVNVWFYGNAPWSIAPYIQVAFIVGAAFWATIQMYTFPFLIEQEQPSLKTALRNSFLAVARFPLRSFGLLLLMVAIVLVSTYLYFVLWVVITISLMAYLMNKNTLVVVKKFMEQKQKPEEGEK